MTETNSILTSLIDNLEELGFVLERLANQTNEIKDRAKNGNPWFTMENINMACHQWASSLKREKIKYWLSLYPTLQEQWVNIQKDQNRCKTIGLVMAGNIPFVGLHDLIGSLISGYRVIVKLSSQDAFLIPYIYNEFLSTLPNFKDKVEFKQKISGFDYVIATGSNNTARYFEYYFRDYPHKIRKNRNSIAILSGQESKKELEELGNDIFSYFGLGCRNVSKLYVPSYYDFSTLFTCLEPYSYLLQHSNYGHNLTYQRTLLLLNKEKYLENGFLFLKESPLLYSPISLLHYEFYEPNLISELLKPIEQDLQCILTNSEYWEQLNPSSNQSLISVPFGKGQSPDLWDYADQWDTLNFLLHNP